MDDTEIIICSVCNGVGTVMIGPPGEEEETTCVCQIREETEE